MRPKPRANIAAMSNKTDDDAQLFRQAMKGVRRLKTDHPALPQPRPKPVKRHAPIDEQQALDTLSDEFEPHQENDSFARTGIQKQLLRKLRLGKIPVEEELDLHGYRVEQARQAVAGFLNHCREHGLRCVRIIHGKGLSSQQQPVLKAKTRRWLQQRDDVLAFCPAPRTGGGDGAVYVLLKRS